MTRTDWQSGGSHPLDQQEIEQLKLALSEVEADRQSLQQRLDESKAAEKRLTAQLKERKRDYASSLAEMAAALAEATQRAERAEAERDMFARAIANVVVLGQDRLSKEAQGIVADLLRLDHLHDPIECACELSEVGTTPVRDPAHPESYCHRCKGPNVSWSAPSPLWNEVMRGGDINGPWRYDEIICPTCFAVLAEEAGIANYWQFNAPCTTRPLTCVTPSGRVYDWDRWLWVEPSDLDADLADINRRVALDQRVLDAAEAWHDWFPYIDSMFVPENALLYAVRARRALDGPEIATAQPVPQETP